MPQSLARVLVHLVFSTKNREPLIGEACRAETFTYLGGVLNAIECPVVTVGGVADHVHLLFVLARTLPLSKAVEELKKESSKRAKARVHPGFYWQAGYGGVLGQPVERPTGCGVHRQPRGKPPGPDVPRRVPRTVAEARDRMG